jgi:hypothetical protein
MRITLILATLAIVSLSARVTSGETPFAWPPLPNTGFVRGRAATNDDVRTGAVAFVLAANGKPIGRPLDIAIPQYALWHDVRTGTDTPVIIIQAETNGTIDVVGCMGIADHAVRVALLKEFTLLGTDVHKLSSPNNRWREP